MIYKLYLLWLTTKWREKEEGHCSREDHSKNDFESRQEDLGKRISTYPFDGNLTPITLTFTKKSDHIVTRYFK